MDKIKTSSSQHVYPPHLGECEDATVPDISTINSFGGGVAEAGNEFFGTQCSKINSFGGGVDFSSQDAENDSEEKTIYVSENFRTIIGDFINDLTATFPEYSFLWEKWSYKNTLKDHEIIELFEYTLKIYPERFFDILYQNDEIFNVDSETNTFFLPNVDFKALFNCDGISEHTRKVLWKYLQLILFSVLSSVNDKKKFGETVNIFEGLDENILQEKLEETIKGMNDIFANITTTSTDTNQKSENNDSSSNEQDENTKDSPKMSFDFENNLPNPEELHEHLKTLFDGKIGKLAKELAEEISEDINQFIEKDDLENVKTSQDVIKTLLKNPKKMMDLVKNVGAKLNKKMENGEISQEDMIKEAGELFSKMKDMKGTKQFNEMFKNMAKQMGMYKSGMKTDTNAMEQKMKSLEIKEKLRKRLQSKNMKCKISSEQVEGSGEDVTESTNDFFGMKFRKNEGENNISSNQNMNPLQEIENIMKTLGLSDMKNQEDVTKNTNKNNKKNKKR